MIGGFAEFPDRFGFERWLKAFSFDPFMLDTITFFSYFGLLARRIF
jgi:hypothetical protein